MVQVGVNPALVSPAAKYDTVLVAIWSLLIYRTSRCHSQPRFFCLAIRNQAIFGVAKRKCRRIRNTLILGLACMIHKSLGICESCRLVHWAFKAALDFSVFSASAGAFFTGRFTEVSA